MKNKINNDIKNIIEKRGYRYIPDEDCWEKIINGKKFRFRANGKGILPTYHPYNNNNIIRYEQIDSETELDSFEGRASKLDPSQI